MKDKIRRRDDDNDDNDDDDKVRCMYACMCTRVLHGVALSCAKLFLLQSLSVRGFSSPFFFSRGDLPLVFAKTNAGWKKKDLPIYPRPRIRALTCHLGCLGRRRS